MKDFYDIKGYENFKREAHNLLINTLSEFFSAEVRLHFKPITELHYYGVDVNLAPKRDVYHIDQNTVILVSHAQCDAELYLLGIKIVSSHLADLKKIFNMTARAISGCLNQCVYSRFRNAVSLMGDRLIVSLIGKYMKTCNYDSSKVMHMVDKFMALRSTTFEGKHFSTGLLLTRSLHDYKERGEEGRKGVLLSLNRPMGYLDRIDNRFWYLADGFRTFFVTDLKMDINKMFVYSGQDSNHFKNMVLYETLKGGDVLFRVEAGREVSIITARGIEFINQENSWRYRDYELLKKRIIKAVKLDDEVYNSLLYYVLYCSKNDISSLIWIPKDLSKYKDNLKTSTINKIARTTFNIKDRAYSTLIKRLLSSDGATVINSDGDVVAFGCMVDTTSAKPTGIKGTGETAAGQLAKNGVAIKVSQDGTIKVFLNGKEKPIKF